MTGYLGRQQLGTWLDVYLQCVNASRTPLMPTAVPTIKIRNASGTVVYSGLMPVVDKSNNVGLFCTRLLLGSGISVGTHTVQMNYVAGGPFIVSRTFEVVAAGHPSGQVLGMSYFHSPSFEAIVYQVESGSILKGKSPRIS